MFSVLLSIYKNEKKQYLSSALESILKQTLLPIEIILVKDGPLTEDLEEVILEYQRKFPIIHVVALPFNQGLGKALNEGLKYCSY